MPRWWARPGLVLLVIVTAVAAVTSGSHAATRHEATSAYGTHTRQSVDAYWYDTATARPALLILHGGYWNSGSKTDWAGTARYFADHGFAVFAADYRYNTDVAWPGPRDDAIAALQWIKTHAAINTPYTAWSQAPTTSATSTRRKIRDEAVIQERCYPDQTDTDCWNRWTDAVVKNHASTGDAPMFLLHSQGDFVPSTHSADLCGALTAKKISCTLTAVPGRGHASAILNICGIHTKILNWLQAHD